MIVSHQYRFIFIKTKKTAGTSMEIALSRYCGTSDIISPIAPEDEVIRKAQGIRGPQNYLLPWNEYGAMDWARLLVRRKKAKTFYNHISASLARERLGEEIWRTYYKFCFDRNPWDKVISYYFWHYRNASCRPDLNTFIIQDPDSVLQPWASAQESMYRENGEIIVDDVYRFEDLATLAPILSKKLGLGGELTVPRTKSASRSDRRTPREALTVRSIERIGELFAKEIAHLRYSID